MAKKDDYLLIKELIKLRKKEVVEGLSYEGERRLSTVINEIEQVYAKKEPINADAQQMDLEMAIIAVRNPEFEMLIEKQTIFHKLFKKEPKIIYELIINEDDDNLQYEKYTYRFMLSFRDFMKEMGFGNEWTKMLPSAFDMPEGMDFFFTKEEMEWIKQLPDPKSCLQMINRVENIEDKALMNRQAMADLVKWIKKRWEEGYSIYIDFTELQFIRLW